MVDVGTASFDLRPCRAFARNLVAAMTLAEKAGQMTQVEKNSITPAEVATFAVGSVLSGAGGNPEPNTPVAWRAMVGDYLAGARRSRLGIPLLYGTDAVHGHGNVVGATMFPHNIGLGATGDAELVERVYRATAQETAATGARWDFAPTLAVALDSRWGRTYEAFGDDPELVGQLGAAAVRGLQGTDPAAGHAVAACLKHYVGDGGTSWDTVRRLEWIDWWDEWGPDWRIDQGDTVVDETTLRAVHLQPYVDALAAGGLTVMASYSSWNGEKLHGHRYLLTELLKGELGFAGFVVSDWLGIAQLDPDSRTCAVRAIEAGIDMVMVPFEYRRFIDDVVGAVESGRLDPARVDDAAERIITVKHALGLFADPTPSLPDLDCVGAPEHRRLARQAAAASVVRLCDARRVLPIAGGPVLVAGKAADDIGLQCGGWTVEWQGGTGAITPGTTVLGGLCERLGSDRIRYRPEADFPSGAAATVGIAVVAEAPYAEGAGDRHDLSLPPEDVELVAALRPLVDRLVLVVVSGRPLMLDAVIDRCDAVVAAWLPGSEGAGVADVLTGVAPFVGRLPRAWPGRTGPDGRTWTRGYGVVT